MRTRLTLSLTTIALSLLIVWSSVGIERAYSAGLLDLIPGLGSLTGNTVTIVGDISPNTIQNTVNTALTLARTVDSLGRLSSIDIKEKFLDPIAWNVAKKLQQQLTGNMLKWLGGQLPGQNGEVQFITDYAQNDQDILAFIMGQYLTEDMAGDSAGSCNPVHSFRVRTAVLNAYREDVVSAEQGTALSCSDGTTTGPDRTYSSLAHKLMGDFLECRDETCAFFASRIESYERALQAQKNEREIRSYSGGMKTQRVCRVVTDPDGKNRQLCEIVTPPYLAREAVTQQLVRAPSEQLLQIDEFNEIVSDWVSNLASQALTGLSGILGMSGNPVFGPTGSLSYVDQLLQDDISLLQSGGQNPIKSAIDAEQKYISLQTQVLNRVTDLENQKAAAPSCSSLSMPTELTDAKSTAQSELAYSNILLNGDPSTGQPGLLNLQQAYASTTDATLHSQIMVAYSELESAGALRNEAENQQFEGQYINYEFSLATEQFQCQLTACGASGTCILSTP